MNKKALWDLTKQFNAKNGTLLVGGKIYIYFEGRTALADTWKDEAGTVLNQNPVLLDNNGRANVFVNPIYKYTIVVTNFYGVELFSSDITIHDAISSAEEIVIVGSDGSVLVNDTQLPNGVQYDLSVNKNIMATKSSVDDVIDDLGELSDIVNTNTTDISNINTALGNKKDKQAIYNASGSQTKAITSITQDDNGEIDVTYSDIDLATKDSVDDVISDLGGLTDIVNTHTTDISNINTSLGNKKDRQSIYNASGGPTKTITSLTQDDNGELQVTYSDIDLPPQVPNIEITSDNDSIGISESTDAITNTKTIDLQIKSNTEYGQFSASNVVVGANLSKVKGSLELSNGNIKLKKGSSYHFTLRGEYIAVRANTIDVIDFIEHSSGNVIKVDVDNTVDGVQHFELSYDVYNLTQDINYSVSFNNLPGIISELSLYVHNIGAVSSGSGSGTPVNYDSLYNTVSSNSANWDNAYNTVDSSSPNWDNTYNTVLANSATWNEGGGYTDIELYSSDGSLLISADGSAYDLKLNEQLSAKNYFVPNITGYDFQIPFGLQANEYFGWNSPRSTDLTCYRDVSGSLPWEQDDFANLRSIKIPKEMKLFELGAEFEINTTPEQISAFNYGLDISIYLDDVVVCEYKDVYDMLNGRENINFNKLIYNPFDHDALMTFKSNSEFPNNWRRLCINDETYRSIGTSGSGIPDNYDSLYNTVSSNSASWNAGGGEGATYSAGPNINITNDTISGKDWSNEINTKLDTSAFTLPSSANWDNTYNTVSSNSATWNNNSQIINHNQVASGTLEVNNNEYINVSDLEVSGVLTVKAMNTLVSNGEPITQCGGKLSFTTSPSSINFVDSNDTALPKLDGIPTTFSGNAYQFIIINGIVACQEIK